MVSTAGARCARHMYASAQETRNEAIAKLDGVPPMPVSRNPRSAQGTAAHRTCLARPLRIATSDIPQHPPPHACAPAHTHHQPAHETQPSTHSITNGNNCTWYESLSRLARSRGLSRCFWNRLRNNYPTTSASPEPVANAEASNRESCRDLRFLRFLKNPCELAQVHADGSDVITIVALLLTPLGCSRLDQLGHCDRRILVTS